MIHIKACPLCEFMLLAWLLSSGCVVENTLKFVAFSQPALCGIILLPCQDKAGSSVMPPTRPHPFFCICMYMCMCSYIHVEASCLPQMPFLRSCPLCNRVFSLGPKTQQVVYTGWQEPRDPCLHVPPHPFLFCLLFSDQGFGLELGPLCLYFANGAIHPPCLCPLSCKVMHKSCLS